MNKGKYRSSMNTYGIKALRTAVVEQALIDYVTILIKGGKHKKASNKVRNEHLQELLNWFHSEDFLLWSDLDADTIPKQIHWNLNKGFIFHSDYTEHNNPRKDIQKWLKEANIAS